MELTKEHFDKMLAKLATSEELQSVKTEITEIKTTLDRNNSALADLAPDVKKLLDHKTITNDRLDNLETWARPAGAKLVIELER